MEPIISSIHRRRWWGGVGDLSFAWYDRPEAGPLAVIATAMDPAPLQLQPGVHYIKLVVSDQRGQINETAEVKVVKVGDPATPSLHKGVEMLANALVYRYTPEQIDAAIENLIDLGPDFVRIVFTWDWLQPERGGHIYWEHYTPIVQKIKDAGIPHIIGCVHRTPLWASARTTASPPRDIQDFVAFYKEFLREYKDLVDIFEIYNEPNNRGEFDTPTPVEDYFRLLRTGYLLVKYEVSPSSPVLLGGLNGSGEDVEYGYPNFLTELYEMGGAEYFDIVGIHPYVYPKKAPSAIAYAAYLKGRTLATMSRFGDTAPLIASEIGWPSHFDPGQWWEFPITEEEQAQWLRAVFGEYLVKDHVPVSWYRFNDGTDVVDFGLIRFDLSRRPAFQAFQQIPK